MRPLSESPHVSVVNLRPVALQLLEQEYAATLRIQNPNNSTLRIEGLSFKLELNGSPLARGVSNQKVTVPAYGESKIDVTMVSGTLGIIRQIQALEQQKQSLDYRLSGKLSLTGHLLPLAFEREGTINFAPQSP